LPIPVHVHKLPDGHRITVRPMRVSSSLYWPCLYASLGAFHPEAHHSPVASVQLARADLRLLTRLKSVRTSCSSPTNSLKSARASFPAPADGARSAHAS